MAQSTKRYEQLKKKICQTGLILKGTITERVIVRGKNKFGPYYQWTFKIANKTVTVNLTKEQEKEYSKAIRNYKRIKDILKEMEKVSLEILESSMVTVKRRKKKSP